VRQFLAVELSEAWREDLRSLQQEFRAETTGWRWVRPASIHLTLRFLGEVPDAVDGHYRDSWREVAAAARPFSLRLDGVGSFPPRGRPRVLWVGVREEGPEGRLARLAASFETAAREIGLAPEHRPFRPHLTLARVDRSGRVTLPARDAFASPSVLGVDRVALFRSQLLPTGARYELLETFPLLAR